MAFVSPISEASRDRETEAVTDAANVAMTDVSIQMAGAIAASGPTYQADELYDEAWWDDAVDTYIVVALALAIERYGLESARNYGVPILTLRGTTWALGKAGLLEAQADSVKHYNDTISNRVAELAAEANDSGWGDAELAANLGLVQDRGLTALEVATLLPAPPGGRPPTVPASAVQPGPLSPGIAQGIGETEAHTAAEGVASGVGNASGRQGFKRWDTSFVNSRQTHQDANGQIAPVREFFDVGGEIAMYPGDWNLSAANRINCQCSAGFEYVEAGTDWVQEPSGLREDQLAARRQTIEDRVNSKPTTDKTFNRRGESGKGWDAERARIHNEILDDVWARAANVPNEGEVIFSGGMGGAGKGTTLRSEAAGIDQARFLELNADVMKEELAKRGLIPIGEGLTQLEGAALVHKESSYLADRLAERAYADRKNIIWDTTMRDAAKTGRQIDSVIAAGYDTPQLIFVDIPVETSVSRALSRHQRGLEDALSGAEGALGGRYVPPDVIRDLAGTRLESVNLEAFEELINSKDVTWQLFNNAGDAPVLIAEGTEGALILNLI